MSGHMSKCLKSESTGRLTEDELCHAAGLLHALVYDQNRFIAEKIARQLHGKNMAVHAGEVLAQIGAMNDSSKRRWDASDDLSSVSETGFHVPQPAAGYAAGSTKDMKHVEGFTSVTAGDANVKLPKGINSEHEWGRTVIVMKKYAEKEITYAQLVNMAKHDKDAERYVGWIQNTYTPKDEDMQNLQNAGGVTQAIDFARYLKKIRWKKDGHREFVRRLKWSQKGKAIKKHMNLEPLLRMRHCEGVWNSTSLRWLCMDVLLKGGELASVGSWLKGPWADIRRLGGKQKQRQLCVRVVCP